MSDLLIELSKEPVWWSALAAAVWLVFGSRGPRPGSWRFGLVKLGVCVGFIWAVALGASVGLAVTSVLLGLSLLRDYRKRRDARELRARAEADRASVAQGRDGDTGKLAFHEVVVVEDPRRQAAGDPGGVHLDIFVSARCSSFVGLMFQTTPWRFKKAEVTTGICLSRAQAEAMVEHVIRAARGGYTWSDRFKDTDGVPCVLTVTSDPADVSVTWPPSDAVGDVWLRLVSGSYDHVAYVSWTRAVEALASYFDRASMYVRD